MNNGTAFMQPNTDLYNPSDAFWTNPDGTPAKWVEEDYYIANDILAGQGLTLTFSGYCPSNSIPAPYSVFAWVEDFVPNYSSLNGVTTNLIAGQPFSITLNTAVGAGRHIQYGLRVLGLDNAPTNSDTATAVIVTPPQPTITAMLSNKAVNLSFAPTALGHNYGVQYTTNLGNPSWQTLSTLPGIDAAQTLTDPVGPGARFYRVHVQ
jgi:hypothetical protein